LFGVVFGSLVSGSDWKAGFSTLPLKWCIMPAAVKMVKTSKATAMKRRLWFLFIGVLVRFIDVVE